MKPATVIAKLLLAYWVIVGFVNLAVFAGFGWRGFGELVGYIAVGALCCFATMKIGSWASRFRKSAGRSQTSRWWS